MYPITSRYLEQESFRQRPHLGIDFQMNNSTPLRSIQEGVIQKVVDYGDLNVGKAVFVKWTDGKIAIYGHMSQISVSEGQKIGIGDLLGYSGNSGFVVGKNGGYHLHFGLKEGGKFIDPSPYVDAIQHMNKGDKLKALVCQPEVGSQTTGLSFGELFNSSMNIYHDLFQSFKLNLIHVWSSIDYTMLIQHIQHLFQFFLS